MHRFITLACAVAAATVVVVGCGSSGDDSSPGGGGSGGSGGSASDAQCAGAYSDRKASAFVAATTADKGCTADAATACSNDMTTVTGTCGKTCLVMAASDDDSQATCVAECINENLSTGSTPISDSCLACYTTDVACARHNCFAQCGIAPTSAGCAQCRVDMGCAAPFYACSGLPIPTGLTLGNGAAGAGDQNGSSGAGG
jgi:hypothetical protein